MRQKSTRRTLLTIAAALAPASALAATSIIELSQTIQRTVYKPLVVVIVSFALLLFVWGIYKYIAQSGGERDAAEGSKLMSYGVLVLFVMFTVWGLVKLLLDGLGISQGDANPIQSPNFDSTSPSPFEFIS